MTTAYRPLNKEIRERLAACEACGLSYWGDHPAAAHFWAVDDHQRAHVVRINREASTAQHVCRTVAASLCDAEQCAGAAEAVPYTVQDQTGQEPLVMNESGPTPIPLQSRRTHYDEYTTDNRAALPQRERAGRDTASRPV